MKIYGLTGGIACGKSTVSHFFRELGAAVVDADAASRLVMQAGHPTYAAVVDLFGKEILHKEGQINREALGQIVFNDAQKRTQLEQLTHPAIRMEVAQQLSEAAQKGIPIGMVEAALLIENGSYRQYAGLIVVSCHPDIQRQRLMQRNQMTEAEAQKRIDSQWPLAQKEAFADWLIRNDSDLGALRAQTNAVWEALTDMLP